jgi:hypothetical protein
LGFPEDGEGGYDSVEVVFVSQNKAKIDEIEKLWAIVQKESHVLHSKKFTSTLNELKNKFGIICWSGEELRIIERELQ